MSNIQQFISDNEDMNVTISEGVTYSLREIIENNYRLYNGQFEQPNDNGLQKIFYRMIWVIFRTIIMSSDIDLKDINVRSLNGQGIKTLAVLKLAMRSHLMRTGFGRFIDQTLEYMVWFGSSITKRVDGEVYRVDLRNYITEPTIQDPQERSHAEMVYYTWDQVCSYKEDWKDNWDKIEYAWEKMNRTGKFKIVEFWTWGEVDGKTHKVCEKYLDVDNTLDTEDADVTEWSPYILLDRFVTPYTRARDSKRMSDKVGELEEMFPYEQADFFEVPGRWMCMGCGELLAGLQEHYNEQFNLKRKKDILDLRGIFVHKYTNSSNSLTQDFLNNLETGDVISMDVEEDLQRLIIDTKTSEFIANIDKLYELMRLIMGVSAQGTGEELPGSTSATGIKANFATQQTTYDYVRERIHHFVQRLFGNGYLKDVMDEITIKKMIAITGSPKEIAELDQHLVKKAVNTKTQERYAQLEQSREEENEDGTMTEGYVSWDEVEMLDALEEAETKDLLEQFKQMGNERWTELKKEMFETYQYVLEFYVNSEAFDKSNKLQVLQGMKADPTFTGSRQAVDDAIFDLMNENPRQFDKTEAEKAAEAEAQRQQLMADSGQMMPPAPMGAEAPMPAPTM